MENEERRSPPLRSGRATRAAAPLRGSAPLPGREPLASRALRKGERRPPRCCEGAGGERGREARGPLAPPGPGSRRSLLGRRRHLVSQPLLSRTQNAPSLQPPLLHRAGHAGSGAGRPGARAEARPPPASNAPARGAARAETRRRDGRRKPSAHARAPPFRCANERRRFPSAPSTASRRVLGVRVRVTEARGRAEGERRACPQCSLKGLERRAAGRACMGLRAVGLVTRAVFSLVGSVCTGKRQAALSLPAQRCWLFRAVSYVEPCLLVSELPAFKP